MNQFNWIYRSDRGKPYHIGVAHGADTGHLIVYCNSNIMVIDFNVLQPKQYSFFIEDELMNLSIQKEDTDFSYACQIDKAANTPKNQQRKLADQQAWYRVVAFIVLILLAGLFIYNNLS